MKTTNVYTSIACNRTTHCADWGSNGLIAFGASCAVALLDPKYHGNSAKILHTYVQHTKRVNTVQWIRNDAAAEIYLLSGSDDGMAILWHLANLHTPNYYALKGHESGVNALCGLQRDNGQLCLATAAADSSLKLWSFDGEKVSCFQTVHLSGGFCFSLRLTALPKSEQVLLAFSSDDETISLWAQQAQLQNANGQDPQAFVYVHKLTGHEDWVRSLDIVAVDNDLLLASGSQDHFIRLWRIAPRTEAQVRENSVNLINIYNESSAEIRVEEKIVQVSDNAWYAVSLESVLYGHNGWVYGVNWHKSEKHGLRLLSASIDKTIIIWEPTEDGIWMEKIRVGEVGGNSLGFFGGKFASTGTSIMGHSYQGGFHIWDQSTDNSYQWTPNVIVSGHFGEMRDLAWEPQGEFLVSVSADQTTRLHAPWRQADDACESTWHEIARPQVHGYDMQALAMLSRYKFASGAEEKIVRTFQAPGNFVDNFRLLCKITNDAEGDALLKSLPKGASVPSLGLSNKAVYTLEQPDEEEKHVKDEYPENYFVPVTLKTPPQEETLMQNTLWPEMQKLYGHGYEIYALAATPNGQILASSCRSSNAEHAQIILWNTSNWKQLQKLSSHQLTVTQLRFSPDARYLLSVSRDRRWTLFERNTKDNATLPSYTLAATTDKKNGLHMRIIWACDWSHDGKYFATSSRDGKVVVWTHSETVPTVQSSLNSWHAAHTLELKNESITTLAFAPYSVAGAYIVALGFETGHITIYKLDEQWQSLIELKKDQSHHLTVKRLQFRPLTAANNLQLASCGDDNLVRIYELIFN